MEHSKAFVISSWALRGIVAVILLQTLFFKFTGAKESIYIFTTLGAEPWGRIGSGVVELIASILLLMPRTAVFGAILALGTICGAIFAHLTTPGKGSEQGRCVCCRSQFPERGCRRVDLLYDVHFATCNDRAGARGVGN